MTKCSGEPHTFFGYCERKPTVERDGKPYCWQHDPERRRAKARARAEADRQHEKKLEREWARMDLERSAGLRPDQVAKLTDEQVRMIADAGGITAFVCEPGPDR
jgi:hypothetical protein